MTLPVPVPSAASAASATHSFTPRRWLLAAAGYAFFAVGFVGMFLPVLPTTVFWIVAAICFARSSPAMYRRLLSWPGIGAAISDFIGHGVIRPAGKRIAVAGMAAAALIILLTGIGPALSAAALGGIGLAAFYVVTRPGPV